MNKKRPQILITNDDGYAAKGLRKLVTLMRTLGDVTLVSTDEVMSAKSHSCTIRERLYVRLVHEEDGFKEYRCNGTPVDCVKLGYQKLMPEPPDLLVSGINHGMNAATTVVYSGTIGAVIEACMNGLTAIGFSLFSLNPDADFDHVDTAVLEITKKVLKEGLPQGVCLNVNFPNAARNLSRASRCAVRQPAAGWSCLRTNMMRTARSTMTWKVPFRVTTSCLIPTCGPCSTTMSRWCLHASTGRRTAILNR